MNGLQITENRSQMSEVRFFYFLSSVLCFLSSVFCPLSSVCYAEPLSSSELINRAQQYDGEKIVYQGEVIGEIMRRGKFAWLNVNDGANALGVFCAQDLVSKITYAGNYNFKGDIVKVNGEFHRACPQHGGDMDIHADKITVSQKGEGIAHPLELKKAKASIFLSAIAFALVIIHLIIKRFR